MEVKTVELPKGMLINVIPSKEFTFLIPVSALAETLGYKTTAISNIAKQAVYKENIHVVSYQGDESAYYKALRKNTLLLTRLGVVAICIRLRTEQSKIIGDWASEQSYKRLIGKSKINDLLHEIQQDASRVSSKIIRERINENVNELKLLI